MRTLWLLACSSLALIACDSEIDGGGVSDVDGGGEVSPVADAAVEDEVDAAPVECSTSTYRLRHLQASMQRTDTVAQRRASIDAAFDAGADTISWTEIENLVMVNRIENRAGWTTFWPSGTPEVRAKNAVPVSWRSDVFELVEGRSWKASDGLAMVSPARFVTRVWLRHIESGQVQSRVAHHSVSGVDGAGKDPVEWRREAHAKNIAKFREAMLLDEVPVIGSADFNTVRLRNLLGDGFVYDVPASGGSHGNRLIDWIVRRPNPELERTGVRFMQLGSSDHRGVRAGYDYTPACEG